MKTCKTCGISKPLTDFHTTKNCKDGVRGACRVCWAAKSKAYYQANKARLAVTTRTYYQRNKAQKDAKNREWKVRNPERVKAILARYWAKPESRDRLRESRLRREYGLTNAAFDALLLKQNKQCSICRLDEAPGVGWCVDHDHTTGNVRSILCTNCNSGLGMFKDSPELLSHAITYLELHKTA